MATVSGISCCEGGKDAVLVVGKATGFIIISPVE